MAFRADEEKQKGLENAILYLTKNIDAVERNKAIQFIEDVADKYGPVVNCYPTWHPIVSRHDPMKPVRSPSRESGYEGLDHTIHFMNAFITCPYDDGNRVIDSVNRFPLNRLAVISAEHINVKLYNFGTNPILVKCDWEQTIPFDGIPKNLAIPLMLEQELACWGHTQFAETWETMRPYFLGIPSGKRSSLFVNQETGQYMKNIWNQVINSGMFGPIKV